MNYVTTTRICGCNGSNVVLETGSPISLSDLPRLGYKHGPQRAWDSMIEEGEIEQVTTIEGDGQRASTDPLRVWAQTTAPTASYRPPPPELDPANTDRSWVRRC